MLAFAVGLLPDTLLVRLQEIARSFAKTRKTTLSLVERYPLTDLEGIDIYDRARLLDEGVGNIEGLAHHDLPSLMMYTRIPAGRLVHWTDQAILFLHVAATTEKDDEAEVRLAKLKSHGIHTATDLESARRAAAARSRAKASANGDQGPSELDAFLFLLGEGTLPRIQVILDAIADEQWMRNLRYWHRSDHDEPKTLRLEGERAVEVAGEPDDIPRPVEEHARTKGTDGGKVRARTTASR